MVNSQEKNCLVLVVVLMLLAFSGSPGPAVPVTPPQDASIIMLYEASEGPLPHYAIGAANEISAAGRDVRMTDDDVTDGLGEVPVWLKPALEPGRALMGADQKGDALILVGNGKALKASKMPATKELIKEFVK